MATTDIQNSVYKTIDVIVNKRIEDLHLDKTIECVIDSCIDLQSKKYRVRYGSGYFDAYAVNDDIYVPQTAVYVLVPENNFNQRKTIIGKTNAGSQATSAEQIDLSIYNGYSIIGQNLLFKEENYIKSDSIKEGSIQINSTYENCIYGLYPGWRSCILYDITQPSSKNILKINNKSLKVYLQEAQGFLFSGQFKTSFGSTQIKTGNENYGLKFTITLKNGNTEYTTMQERWDDQVKYLKAEIIENGEASIRDLSFYKEEIEEIFNNAILDNEIKINDLKNELSVEADKIYYFLQIVSTTNNDADELAILFYQLINELIDYSLDVDGQIITKEQLFDIYTKWFINESYAAKQQQYYVNLDTQKMVGNVYHFNNWVKQEYLIDINPETFVQIDKIEFFAENFNDKDYKDIDIQVKDIHINCIKFLNDQDNDYYLDINRTQTYFDSLAADNDTISVNSKLIYKKTTDITQYARILWFKSNPKITFDSSEYSIYGGEGWEKISTEDDTSLIINCQNNTMYKNKYKVVAIYESITIEKEFVIYNLKYKYNIELVSNSGIYFSNSSDYKTITCKIDNVDAISSLYSFQWFIKYEQYDINDNLITDPYSIIISKARQELETNNEKLKILNAILDLNKNFDTDINTYYKINIPPSIFDSLNETKRIKATIGCIFYIDGNEFAQPDILLTNIRSNSYMEDYYIEIVNGNQVFQYNEMGISPASTRYENPQILQTLSCRLRDPNGGIIKSTQYEDSVWWEVPFTDTLLSFDDTSLTWDNDNYIVQGTICNFNIADEYNYNYTNNQIFCNITFNGFTYRQSTNFFFGKIGDSGTNGTDIITKITSIPNNKIGLDNKTKTAIQEEALTLNIDKTEENQTTLKWNNGKNISEPVLQLELFRKNELIDPQEYKRTSWSILNNGLSSKYWTPLGQTLTDDSKVVTLTYDENKNSSQYTNYIIKSQASLPIDEENIQTYYGFYPIYTKTQYKNTDYTVGIDKTKILREVVYNADGRRPQYNKNLGIGLIFHNLTQDKKVVWEPHGGIILGDSKEDTPAFSLGKNESIVLGFKGQDKASIINDLKSKKKTEIDTELANQRYMIESNDDPNKYGYVFDLQELLINRKKELENQKTNIENDLNNKIQSRKGGWNQFIDDNKFTIGKTQDLNSIEIYYNDLINDFNNIFNTEIETEDSSGENQQEKKILESFIYDKEDNLVYSNPVGNEFIQEISKYLEASIKRDSINKNFSSDILTDEEKNILNKKEKLLEYHLKFEDESEVEKSLIEKFRNFVNSTIIGYEVNITIFDIEETDLELEITELQAILTELIQQSEIYTNKTLDNINDLVKKPVGKDKEETYIYQLIFDGKTEYDFFNENQWIQYLCYELQEIYEEKIKEIEDKYDFQIKFLQDQLTADENPSFCSILPNEVYSGEYTNQYVKIFIYGTENNTEILEYEFIVPIHMSLNTYGLAFLNNWDGNGIEINENEGYILTPQIGAGIKHLDDNKFTGIVMGTEKTYEDEEVQEEQGLFGYSRGKRSIFLDSVTGNATFGLPEDNALDPSNPFTEGRIELRPGGTSSISKWKFDSRSLYKVVTEKETELLKASQNKGYKNEISTEGLIKPYDDAPQYAHGSIPHTEQGILLSALPAYASFKGRQLNEQDHIDKKVNYLNLNTTVREGDSFELQIDPNDANFFTLYEHSSRLTYGEGFCDTWGNFNTKNNNPYDINPDTQIDTLPNDFVINNEDYVICQQYYKSDSGGSVRRFRPLTRLKKIDNKLQWEFIFSLINEKNGKYESINEYVIGECKQYREWTGSKEKKTVWKFISFTDPQDIPITKVEYETDKQGEDTNIIQKLLVDETKINNRIWSRYRKAGIDATGKFTAESIGLGSIGMGLGTIAAFKPSLYFIGSSIEQEETPLIQFFIDRQTNNVDDSPVYVSSSKTLTGNSADEGKRPIKIYAGRQSTNNNVSKYTSWFGQDWYKTGIYVGRTTEKSPTKAISKIELWQTSDTNNNIELAALGSSDKYKSELKLHTNNNNTEKGSLNHTGPWDTAIGKQLVNTINGDIKNYVNGSRVMSSNWPNRKSSIETKTKEGFYIRTNTTSENVANTGINFRNILYMEHYKNDTEQISCIGLKNNANEANRTDNIFLLQNKSEYFAYNQIYLRGGYHHTTSRTNDYNIIIDAEHTNNGLLLRSFLDDINDKVGKIVAGKTVARSDASYFRLMPQSFELYGGMTSYIYSLNGGSTVYLGTNANVSNTLTVGGKLTANGGAQITGGKLIVGAEENKDKNGFYTGLIYGNGSNIKNTSDSKKAISKTLSPSFGGSSSITIHDVTRDKHGRPEIGTCTITVKLPAQQSLSSYVTNTQLSRDLSQKVSKKVISAPKLPAIELSVDSSGKVTGAHYNPVQAALYASAMASLVLALR